MKESPMLQSTDKVDYEKGTSTKINFNDGMSCKTMETCNFDMGPPQDEWIAQPNETGKTLGKYKSQQPTNDGMADGKFFQSQCDSPICGDGISAPVKCDGIMPVMAQEDNNFAFLQECSNLETGSYINATSQNVDMMVNTRTTGNMVLVATKLGAKQFDPDITVLGLGEVDFASETVVTTVRTGINLGKFEVDID